MIRYTCCVRILFFSLFSLGRPFHLLTSSSRRNICHFRVPNLCSNKQMRAHTHNMFSNKPTHIVLYSCNMHDYAALIIHITYSTSMYTNNFGMILINWNFLTEPLQQERPLLAVNIPTLPTTPSGADRGTTSSNHK
jgi:hypothetical protein